jgi:hypothetical protein
MGRGTGRHDATPSPYKPDSAAGKLRGKRQPPTQITNVGEAAGAAAGSLRRAVGWAEGRVILALRLTFRLAGTIPLGLFRMPFNLGRTSPRWASVLSRSLSMYGLMPVSSRSQQPIDGDCLLHLVDGRSQFGQRSAEHLLVQPHLLQKPVGPVDSHVDRAVGHAAGRLHHIGHDLRQTGLHFRAEPVEDVHHRVGIGCDLDLVNGESRAVCVRPEQQACERAEVLKRLAQHEPHAAVVLQWRGLPVAEHLDHHLTDHTGRQVVPLLHDRRVERGENL